MDLEAQIMSSNLPNRDKLLIDLIDTTADVNKALTRALRYGVEFNHRLYISPAEDIIKVINKFDQISEDLIKQLPRPTISYMTRRVLEEDFEDLPIQYKEEFITTEYSNLIVFMSSIGMDIINKFNLWAYPWKPQIVGEADTSPNHPENLALVVIQTLWRNLQDA